MGFCIAITILIIAFIYLKLDEITQKIKNWYSHKKFYKEIERSHKYLAICDVKAMNGTLKKYMERLEVPTPERDVVVIVFSNSIENLEEFLIKVYGKLSFLDTIKKCTDYTYIDLKQYVKHLKSGNMSLAKVCWDNFLKRDRIINNSLSKTVIQNNETKEIKEEYYCVRCSKKISYENYRLYDSMCEECFQEEILENNSY